MSRKALPTISIGRENGKTIQEISGRGEVVGEQLRLEGKYRGATSEEISVLAKLGRSSSLTGGKQEGGYGCAMTMAATTLGVVE